uniref:Uncharacterized protein n=1 Tax=Arundo donax TaxID=35708 RepID=A0A0A9HLP3_ARUDO
MRRLRPRARGGPGAASTGRGQRAS